MNNLNKFATISTFLCLFSCGQKVTVTNKGTDYSASTSTTTTTTTTTSTSCDGVYRSGVTSCYYKNLPEIALSGPGTKGQTYWSSTNDLSGSGISPNQFSTDATFSVRMIPSYITDGRTSKQGRVCSQYTAKNFTKMQLFVQLVKDGQSVGDTATLTAAATSDGTWNYSNTYRYSVPSGTTSPFKLEVVGVTTDHRCSGKYGTAPTNCTFMDIPLVTKTSAPTECVGFTLQMATDDTYDLPN
jgi:hypothetical protein